MKLMTALAVMASLGMASMAAAETGTWHRSPQYDVGNANRPCPMEVGKPCPDMKDGQPCPMMLEKRGEKPCPMLEGKPCDMMLKKGR